MALKLTVNGEVRCLDPEPMPPTLDKVIAALGHNPQLVVTEHNGVIRPRLNTTSGTKTAARSLRVQLWFRTATTTTKKVSEL